eukprot:CAMPEP_0179329188 /NCGR_PEP_ID=MMETSP0797-20121207/62981_1 /TAXON_ID=47934 /ORGANISM="Dinophysis acuminata, Strain DAEP01" /LENGTH=137 /DNA_ID=CAMNT_0021041801 /DNA_START=25 /DNA_END=435 /DNA_ORIENTATION=-
MASPLKGLWEVDVAKPKAKSKDTCSGCGEVIAPGSLRFRWFPLTDSDAPPTCFDGDCAAQAHEVSRRAIRRSTGLTRDLQAQLNDIVAGGTAGGPLPPAAGATPEARRTTAAAAGGAKSAPKAAQACESPDGRGSRP